MPRLTIKWKEAGTDYTSTPRTYRRFDGVGFGVRFYPAHLAMIKLQIIEDQVNDRRTGETIGVYDRVARVITIEKEL